ncbi:MAG: DUF4923 family protein [Bacteroidaceae bacterium]|nr:DUF4923 family protein [Bacteroidaceae bacterium]
MKKNLFLSALLSATLVLSGCGMMGGGTGSLLGGNGGTLLGGTSDGSNSTLANAGTGILGGILSSILGNSTTNANTIAGTWVYSQPKVTFKSESVLAQIGSSVASSKIESTLDAQLKKLGFQAGKTAIAFDNQGNCQMERGGKTYSGTYTYNKSTGQMTIQGALGVASVSPYVSVVGNEMYMLFEADKLLSVMGTLSSVAKTSTLSSLLSNYNGLQLGWAMQRQ